ISGAFGNAARETVREGTAFKEEAGAGVAEARLVQEVRGPVTHPVQTDLLVASREIHILPGGSRRVGSAHRNVGIGLLLEDVAAEETVLRSDLPVHASRTFIVIEKT